MNSLPTSGESPRPSSEKKNAFLSVPIFLTIFILALTVVFGIKSLQQPSTDTTPAIETESPEQIENVPDEGITYCETTQCPQHTPPAPNFCQDGTLIYNDPIYQEPWECYCETPPSCNKEE